MLRFRIYILSALGFLLTFASYSQTTITWETLSDVTFTDKFSREVNAYYYFPNFGESVLELNNKEVIIEGYILEIDRKNGVYILSANPLAECFFCGGAGPESIVELKLSKGHRRYKIDEIVSFSGVLKLNAVDIYQCNYILENSKEVD